MKILIADNDWQFLRQAREYLEPMGHLVVHESDPDAALGRGESWKPDVVMISAELPACSDGALLGQLQNIRPRPAIVLTAPLEKFGDAWRAWQRGGDELVIKPVLHASELHVALLVAMKNTHAPRHRNTTRPLARSA